MGGAATTLVGTARRGTASAMDNTVTRRGAAPTEDGTVHRPEVNVNPPLEKDAASLGLSATGSKFSDTPMIVPTGEHLDAVKRLMVGDQYI